MKVRALLVAALACGPLAATAGDTPSGPVGAWELPKGAACAMTFRLNDDGHVIRTTAKLEYITKAFLTPDGKGWRLDEQLEKHNGEVSCRGELGDKVVEHLKNPAYIEISGETLRYYPSKGSSKVLAFVRSGI